MVTILVKETCLVLEGLEDVCLEAEVCREVEGCLRDVCLELSLASDLSLDAESEVPVHKHIY